VPENSWTGERPLYLEMWDRMAISFKSVKPSLPHKQVTDFGRDGLSCTIGLDSSDSARCPQTSVQSI